MELKQLYEQMLEKESIKKKLEEYKLQRNELEIKLSELNKVLDKEQKDVDKLENASLTSFFYELLGNKEEKLDKERKEAYEVKIKINTTKFQLESIYSYIKTYEDKLNNIINHQEQYESLLNEKKETLKNHKGIIELEEKISNSLHQQKEINEAIHEAKKAQNLCDKVLSELDDACGIATYDVFMKGGVISHVMKYNAVDRAQEYINQLQVQLNKLSTELIDIKITEEIKISIDSWDKTIDYWFDNIFTDCSIKDKLEQALDQTKYTMNHIQSMIKELNKMNEIEKGKELQLRKEVERIIVNG